MISHLFNQQPECAACEELATSIINLRFSNTRIDHYKVCLEHKLVAQNSIFEFLKHIKNKPKRARKAKR